MKWLLPSAVLTAVFLCPLAAQAKEAGPLMAWMRSLPDGVTGLPVSYRISSAGGGYKDLGGSDSITGVIERMIVRQGVSVYDAAVWQIALARSGREDDRSMASVPVEVYWQGKVRALDNIRAGYGTQPFIYDPGDPEAVSASLEATGKRGFLFRILDSRGEYLSDDPLDGKKQMPGFPNGDAIHWEDWKPIAGENAWVVMGALQLREAKGAGSNGFELDLARELARAALLLQADNGGIRMAPIGTYYHLYGLARPMTEEDVVAQLDAQAMMVEQLDSNTHSRRIGKVLVPEAHMWFYEEISTENNLSWYAALRMLRQVTDDPLYTVAMERIEGYLKSVWNEEGGYLEQGAHWQGGQWVTNRLNFATDVQNWAVASLGPAKVDTLLGEGASWRMWQAVRSRSGVIAVDGRVEGVGFTEAHDQISIEWTAGAILALRKMAGYYATTHPDWAAAAAADADSLRSGIEAYRLHFTDGTDAYAYSSRRGWIPFGWFSHNSDVASLASTAWVACIDQGIDPFSLRAQE